MNDEPDIVEAIQGLRRLLRAGERRVFGEARELTHMEGRALMHVGRRPGATQRELAAQWSRDKAQVARLVANLKDRGLVELRIDETDRRLQRLHLTPEGLELYGRARRERARLARRAISGLADDERRQLFDLLSRVRTNLEGD
jgi:DNA-binding MarR family transcriptional regulator